MSDTLPRPIELVLITGMSGSGKSVALTALEDLGFYCVDNLPPELLESFIALEQSHQAQRVAIAMDVRSAASLPGLPRRLERLQAQADRPVHLTTVFLDATTDTLVRRFSETRRLHPLSLKQANDQHRALTDAIEHERELLAELREQHWLPQMLRDHRSYVTVAIGCTGGQHRSVYLAEQLAQTFATKWATQVRHREVDGWPASAARPAASGS